MSDTTTRGVRVVVRSAFVPERSSPRENHYFFAYRVRISNEGDETVRLVSREWIISDAEGKYSFYGIEPGTHVLKIDPLPDGLHPLPLDQKMSALDRHAVMKDHAHRIFQHGKRQRTEK